MVPTRIRIFKSVNGDWADQCTGAISQVHRDAILVESDEINSYTSLSLNGKSYYKSEDIIVIIHDEKEEHAICFESRDIRNSFFEFLELKDIATLDLPGFNLAEAVGYENEDNNLYSKVEKNYFFSLAKISKYMEDAVFEEMLESRSGVVDLLRIGNFHLFKRLLGSSEKIFMLFEIPFKDKIMPHTFYMELVIKNVNEEMMQLYESFLVMLNKQELMRKEAEISGMSDWEMRDFLKKCCNSCYKVGDAEVYLKKIYEDSIYFPETFYYLCQIFKGRVAEVIDFGLVLDKTKALLNSGSTKDEALYIFEGLYILLDVCRGERLNLFYRELMGFFDDLEYQFDVQRFLIYLFSNHSFRIREFLINTGLLKRIFRIQPSSIRTEMFMVKMLFQVVSCGSEYMHMYFIRNDLLRDIIGMCKDRDKDAVYSAFLQAHSQADGEMKRYFDKYL